MSAPPTSWLSNSAYNKFKGSYFNGDVDASQNIIIRNGNLYLANNSNIYTGTIQLNFDDTYHYLNLYQNFHNYGNLIVDNGISLTGGNLSLPNNSTISTPSHNWITFDSKIGRAHV